LPAGKSRLCISKAVLPTRKAALLIDNRASQRHGAGLQFRRIQFPD
jgi:hypothetical protein